MQNPMYDGTIEDDEDGGGGHTTTTNISPIEVIVATQPSSSSGISTKARQRHNIVSSNSVTSNVSLRSPQLDEQELDADVDLVHFSRMSSRHRDKGRR